MDKQPDIEIYIKHLNAEDLHDWLVLHFDDLKQGNFSTERFQQGKACQIKARHKNNKIPIFITPGAAGKAYCSVWFQSADTPWSNDLECAEDCLKQIDTEIRCSAEGWQEEEALDSEQWWCLTRDGKKRVRWS